MSNRTPRYRSYEKAYGGDPDSSIVKDLHRRLMKVEISLDRERTINRQHREDLRLVQVRLAQLKQLVDLFHAPPGGISVTPQSEVVVHQDREVID